VKNITFYEPRWFNTLFTGVSYRILITSRTNPVNILTPLLQEQLKNNTPSSLIGLSVPIPVHCLAIT